jgi:hypothetical protein
MLAVKRNIAENRHDLLRRLAVARIRTDRLFALVRPDALYERPIAERPSTGTCSAIAFPG